MTFFLLQCISSITEWMHFFFENYCIYCISGRKKKDFFFKGHFRYQSVTSKHQKPDSISIFSIMALKLKKKLTVMYVHICNNKQHNWISFSSIIWGSLYNFYIQFLYYFCVIMKLSKNFKSIFEDQRITMSFLLYIKRCALSNKIVELILYPQ